METTETTEPTWDACYKALAAMEAEFSKAARAASTLEEKLALQKAARITDASLSQHRLLRFVAEDAARLAATVTHCARCGAEEIPM